MSRLPPNYCLFCQISFKSAGGLTQHLQRNRRCKNLKRQEDARCLGITIAYENIAFAQNTSRPVGQRRMEEPETLSPSTEQSRVLAHHFHAARAEAMDIAAQSQFTRGLRAPYQPDPAALAEIGPRVYEYERTTTWRLIGLITTTLRSSPSQSPGQPIRQSGATGSDTMQMLKHSNPLAEISSMRSTFCSLCAEVRPHWTHKRALRSGIFGPRRP